jgi:hypothetical protein
MVGDLPTGVVTLLFTDAFATRPALDRLEADLPAEQLAAARDAAAVATLEELARTARQPN